MVDAYAVFIYFLGDDQGEREQENRQRCNHAGDRPGKEDRQGVLGDDLLRLNALSARSPEHHRHDGIIEFFERIANNAEQQRIPDTS
jgi:hypothetical protein